MKNCCSEVSSSEASKSKTWSARPSMISARVEFIPSNSPDADAQCCHSLCKSQSDHSEDASRIIQRFKNNHVFAFCRATSVVIIILALLILYVASIPPQIRYIKRLMKVVMVQSPSTPCLSEVGGAEKWTKRTSLIINSLSGVTVSICGK